jgi:hypothetical protein
VALPLRTRIKSIIRDLVFGTPEQARRWAGAERMAKELNCPNCGDTNSMRRRLNDGTERYICNSYVDETDFCPCKHEYHQQEQGLTTKPQDPARGELA